MHVLWALEKSGDRRLKGGGKETAGGRVKVRPVSPGGPCDGEARLMKQPWD